MIKHKSYVYKSHLICDCVQYIQQKVIYYLQILSEVVLTVCSTNNRNEFLCVLPSSTRQWQLILVITLTILHHIHRISTLTLQFPHYHYTSPHSYIRHHHHITITYQHPHYITTSPRQYTHISDFITTPSQHHYTTSSQYQYTITILPHHHTPSLHHHRITTPSPHHHHTITTSPPYHHTVTTPSPHRYHTITTPPHHITTPSPHHHTITLIYQTSSPVTVSLQITRHLM